MVNSQHSHTKSGFTIVEVIVVLAVFGVGIIMLSSLMSSLQFAQRNSLYLDIATQAARAKIESIRNSEFSTITNGASFQSELPSALPPGTTATVGVSVPANSPSAKLITATVTYPIGTGSTTRSATITAYVDAPAS